MRTSPLILIVDDDENFCEIITTKLKASGFETAVANTAEAGITEAARLLPDLVLMDIQIGSGPPGTEIALTIKEHPETENLKIAFLTNFKDPFPGMTGTRDEITKELGMEDFLDKTSDLDTLVERVQTILDLGSPEHLESPPLRAVPGPAETPPLPSPSGEISGASPREDTFSASEQEGNPPPAPSPSAGEVPPTA